jgi:hypothetical protein
MLFALKYVIKLNKYDKIITAWEHHVPLAFHLGHEADHSPPSSAKVKEWVELYHHSPNMPSWHGAQLGGAQDDKIIIFSSIWPIESVMNSTIQFFHHF